MSQLCAQFTLSLNGVRSFLTSFWKAELNSFTTTSSENLEGISK